MTYREYLLSQGATEEDIKVLDTPIGRKAFEQMQTVQADHTRLKESADAFQTRVNEYYETEKEKRARIESELVASRAREAATRTALLTAQERGLLDVSKDLGFNLEASAAPPVNNPAAPAFDPNKYFTREDITSMVRQEAAAIAIASTIVDEHRRLFPDKPLDMESLLTRAQERKIPLKQMWMDEFKVPEARAAVAQKAQDDRDNRIRKEAEDKVRAELASQYGNPETRPLAPSHSPFTSRKDTGRDKQPWEVGLDGEAGSNDRVQRAVQRHIARESGSRTN
jgi:hypothetical protein